MKKLYRVEVDVAFDMMVYAENEEVAEIIAKHYAKDDLVSYGRAALECMFDTPRVVTEMDKTNEWYGSIPYSFECREQRTCEQLLAGDKVKS